MKVGAELPRAARESGLDSRAQAAVLAEVRG